MIAATLPLAGGVLDGKTYGVFGKQIREGQQHLRFACLFGHEIRSISSVSADNSIKRGVKSWAQSWLLSLRNKIGGVRLHRGKSDRVCDVDKGLTLSRGGTPDEQEDNLRSILSDTELLTDRMQEWFRLSCKSWKSCIRLFDELCMGWRYSRQSVKATLHHVAKRYCECLFGVEPSDIARHSVNAACNHVSGYWGCKDRVQHVWVGLRELFEDNTNLHDNVFHGFIASPSRGGGHSGTEGSCKSGSYDAELVLARGESSVGFGVHDKEVQQELSDSSEVLVQGPVVSRHYNIAERHSSRSRRQRVRLWHNVLLQLQNKRAVVISGVPNCIVDNCIAISTRNVLYCVEFWFYDLVNMAKSLYDRSDVTYSGGVAHV